MPSPNNAPLATRQGTGEMICRLVIRQLSDFAPAGLAANHIRNLAEQKFATGMLVKPIFKHAEEEIGDRHAAGRDDAACRSPISSSACLKIGLTNIPVANFCSAKFRMWFAARPAGAKSLN